MFDYFNPTLFSLITLTLIIISTLSWLVLRTLKEGKKAIEEINQDLKNNSDKI